MYCPQCGIDLGETARGCSRCGWTSSRRTVWVVLGSVLAGGLLVCCGIGTWAGILVYRAGREFVATVGPEIVFLNRVAVTNYAQRTGKMPETLAEAFSEPLIEEGGKTVRIHLREGQPFRDLWGTEIRYGRGEGGAFEVRSAGPDRTFGTPDDLAEAGRSDDDLAALRREMEDRWRRAGAEALRSLGVDPGEAGLDPGPPPAPPPGGGGQ
jgi:hypothetical protein